jgi:DHA1 family bicyclomycin/chloramphenicol resistance-like MFS transporter
MKHINIPTLILIFSPLILGFAFGLDIYAPVVPYVADIFNTSKFLVQMTLTLFLFFTGIGQLVIGPLSDRFGRRPIFYGSSVAYSMGALLCAFSPTIYILICGRILTSLGACGMLVTSIATVRDIYAGEKSAAILSFFHGVIGIAPLCAPLLGGYLFRYFGWHSVFCFLALLGLIAFLVTHFFIRETHDSIKIKRNILSEYYIIFSDSSFLIYAFIVGAAEGVFFGFFSTSPFLIIEELGVKVEHFGFYFAIFGAVIVVGGFLSGLIVKRLGTKKTLSLGLLLIMLGGLFMLVGHYSVGLSFIAYLLPMSCAVLGAVIVVSTASALALEIFGTLAGAAAAALGAIEFALSALIGSLIMIFPSSSTLPYACAIIIIAFISSILLAAHALAKKSTKAIENS